MHEDEKHPPACADCRYVRYYAHKNLLDETTSQAMCAHPVAMDKHFDPVDGISYKKYNARLIREYGCECGPEGSLFEPSIIARIGRLFRA